MGVGASEVVAVVHSKPKPQPHVLAAGAHTAGRQAGRESTTQAQQLPVHAAPPQTRGATASMLLPSASSCKQQVAGHIAQPPLPLLPARTSTRKKLQLGNADRSQLMLSSCL